jgi:hypothetical protein
MVSFSVTGTGSAVQQSGNNSTLPLGKKRKRCLRPLGLLLRSSSMAAFLLASLLIATGRGTPPLTTYVYCIRSGKTLPLLPAGYSYYSSYDSLGNQAGAVGCVGAVSGREPAVNGGCSRGGRRTFQNLLLTYGRVNNQPVICYVRSMDSACNSQNLLFTKKTGSKAPPFTAAFANLETEARVINLSKNPIAYRLRNNPRLSLASSTVRLGKTEPPCKGKRLGR